jgi:ubiquinone biosynthesis protein UbiJ
MFSAAPLLSLIDRLLDTQPGARARLTPHAGKRARIQLPLGGVDFSLGEQGEVRAAPADTAPDTVITLAADTLLRLALGDKAALRQARIDGDSGLASDISIALNDFDWVLALRPAIGDIAATRVDQAITGLSAWRAHAHESLGRSIAEYATHEAKLLANNAAVERFVGEVSTLRDDVARIEARLVMLEQRRAG